MGENSTGWMETTPSVHSSSGGLSTIHAPMPCWRLIWKRGAELWSFFGPKDTSRSLNACFHAFLASVQRRVEAEAHGPTAGNMWPSPQISPAVISPAGPPRQSVKRPLQADDSQ